MANLLLYYLHKYSQLRNVFSKETLYGYTRLSLLSEKPPADIEDKYSIEFCTETWVVVYRTYNSLLHTHITQDKDKED